MNKEIERKFLVKSFDFTRLPETEYYHIEQGYISFDPVVRVRRITNQYGFSSGVLTIKNNYSGFSCDEYEYNIPDEDALNLLKNIDKLEKVRNIVIHKGALWEVDVFSGNNDGLIIAEVELKSESQKIEIPYFIGEEVTNESKYYNSELIKNPYNKW